MKKLIAIGLMSLLLTTCATSSTAETNTQVIKGATEEISFIDFLIQFKELQDAQDRAIQMQERIAELYPHVDSTWYLFAGSTPEGWDCSGLVMWFYSKFQVELEHSATAQKYSGELVKEPLPGDIVAFSYNGAEKVYHNGLYIGNDLFIHSPRVGKQTKVSSVLQYIGEHSKASFTRIDF